MNPLLKYWTQLFRYYYLYLVNQPSNRVCGKHSTMYRIRVARITLDSKHAFYKQSRAILGKDEKILRVYNLLADSKIDINLRCILNTYLHICSNSWFRHSNGRLSPVSNNIRVSVSEQVLIIRRAQPSDAGLWTCRAHNQYGEQRRDARLTVRSRLAVSVQPQLQV